jgi:hypothetical protein
MSPPHGHAGSQYEYGKIKEYDKRNFRDRTMGTGQQNPLDHEAVLDQEACKSLPCRLMGVSDRHIPPVSPQRIGLV